MLLFNRWYKLPYSTDIAYWSGILHAIRLKSYKSIILDIWFKVVAKETYCMSNELLKSPWVIGLNRLNGFVCKLFCATHTFVALHFLNINVWVNTSFYSKGVLYHSLKCTKPGFIIILSKWMTFSLFLWIRHLTYSTVLHLWWDKKV